MRLLVGIVAAVIAGLLPVARAQTPGNAWPVTVYASVVDREGAFVPGLTAADFALKEDGRPRAIEGMQVDTGPAALVMLLDRSGSVAAQLDVISRLANGVIDQMNAGDRMQIADLDPQSAPRPPSMSSDRAELRAAAGAERSRNPSTALWDRLKAAINRLSGEPGYRAIVVISDGQDVVSLSRHADVTRLAQRARVVIHAIELPVTTPPMVINGRPMPARRSNELRQMVADAGGSRSWLPDAGEDLAIAAITGAIRHRYAITFTPRLMDGKSHELELKTLRKDLTVRLTKRY